MCSKQQIGILKRDGLGKQHFDMENILTRSLYRVLNNTTQVPSHIASKNQNVDKMYFPDRKTSVAVARPNNHQIGNVSSVDMDMQMRLLAQEICGRVERKYERKLDDARENDRREIERRLISIRSEYDAKYQLQSGKLEKEKTRLLDQIAERERTLEHRMEMRAAEKDHDLAAKQRIIENRVIELTLNKENFEKMRDEWHRQMESEMEEMRLERERIEVAAIQTTEKRRSGIAIEAEAGIWKKRAAELEHDANDTRKKIGEIMEENFRMKDQIGALDQIKKELEVTIAALNEARGELADSRVEIRRTADYDHVKNENEQLRIEIERLRQGIAQKVHIAVQETITEYSAKETKWKKVASLCQQRIAILTDKINNLEIERNALLQEVKTRQKMFGKDSSNRNMHHSKTQQSKRMLHSLSRSESTSSLSDGELEILNIRQRIKNLDDIAKELDASVENFSLGGVNRKGFDNNESKVEMYDDFCRTLHNAILDDERSPITSSPQKPVLKNQRKTDGDENLGENLSSFNQNADRDSWLKRGIRVVSPISAQKSIEVSRKSPVTEGIIESGEIAISENKDEMVRTVEPQMPDLERSLQAREESQTNRRNRMLQLSFEPVSAPLPVSSQEKIEESVKPIVADNPMFTGVDPVMAEYMKKVLANRSQKETSGAIAQGIARTDNAPAEASKVREVELTLADELDLELDQPANAGDDWW